METKVDSGITVFVDTKLVDTGYSESEDSHESFEIEEQQQQRTHFETKSFEEKVAPFIPLDQQKSEADTDEGVLHFPIKDGSSKKPSEHTHSFDKASLVTHEGNMSYYRLSAISLTGMNDISLSENSSTAVQLDDKNSSALLVQEHEEEEEEEDGNVHPLRKITSALVSSEKPDITHLSFIPPTHISNQPTHPLAVVALQDHEEQESVVSVTSPTRSIFTLFSSFRSSISSTSTSPASSRRPSKQTTHRPSITAVVNRPSSVLSPLPGFQETLLAQMEQMNQSNTNDPKSTLLKRQSIRQSLVLQHKNNKDDGYDWDFWAGVMCEYQHVQAKVNMKELTKQIRSGIPPSIRGMVWQVLAKSKDEDLAIRYMELLKQQSPYEKSIQRDFSEQYRLDETRVQEGLYHVVKAYSIYDQQVGYCQGLASIARPIVLNMPDEDAFCLLVQFMYTYDLRSHFTADGLLLKLFQLDRLIEEHLPHVARHLKQQDISVSMYASQWFMTLFTYTCPLPLIYRMYDVLLTEGMDSLLKFSIALLKKNETSIIGLDFDDLIDFLKHGPLFEAYKEEDVQFVRDACTLSISTKRLAQLEKEHTAQLQKDMAIEALQKANLDLQQQYKILETKTAVLKTEHDEVDSHVKRTLHKRHALQEEHASLNTVVSTLQSTMETLPAHVAVEAREKRKHLDLEHTALTDKNEALEQRLQRAEMELIRIKMQYAECENEKEELRKTLYDFKKLMSF